MLLSRVRGSLVAAVVGDCIGEMYEGAAYVRMKDLLTTVSEFEQKWSDSRKREAEGRKVRMTRAQMKFTDDTAMARSIAASLVEHQAVNVPDIAARFSKEYAREPGRGYGGNVVSVLQALGDPNLTDLFRPASEQFDGSGSYGNGGGMRICPLGLFFHKQSVEELKEKAISVTRLTHSHPLAIVGAVLQAFAVHLALSLDNRRPLDSDAFMRQLLQQLRPVEEEVNTAHGHTHASGEKADDDSEKIEKLPYCEKLELIKEFLIRDVSAEEVDEKLGTDISALRSIPTAVYCFLKGASKTIPDFEDRSEVEQTILYAISLGGDTDTIATMAGAIAGAFYGVEAVPQSWQDSCEGVRDAIIYADKMVEIFSAAGRA